MFIPQPTVGVKFLSVRIGVYTAFVGVLTPANITSSRYFYYVCGINFSNAVCLARVDWVLADQNPNRGI